jgi:hypothetical protein
MDNQKIKTYITLFIGILIATIVFFIDRGGDLGLRNADPYYSLLVKQLKSFFGIDRDIGSIIWWILLLSFLYFWWKLRNKITNLLMKVHKKV